MTRIHTYDQKSAYESGRPLSQRLLQIIWEYVWSIACIWTPKAFNPWRLFLLRLFGAKLYGTPFVHSRARILVPWNLTMHDRSALGDRANAYTLGEIELKARSTIAQEAYLSTGTHKFDDLSIPLQTAKIIIEQDVFVGARAFIMPGIVVGEGSVVGACAVVTREVPPWTIVAGNPAKQIGKRVIKTIDGAEKLDAGMMSNGGN